MAERPLRILQVGRVETGGGAASVAGHLFRGFRSRGCESWLAVSRKSGADPDVLVIPDEDRPLYRALGYAAAQDRLGHLAGRFPGRGWGLVSRSLRLVTHPRAVMHQFVGREDFEFPGTDRLLDLLSAPPDIVHCHNLHGGYFDLRALERISGKVPTILTLHDEWLLSGHCAHSFDCERWKTGCGTCPDLTIDPPIRRDGTAANWALKRDVYAKSRLYVTTPSRWLLERMEQSMLAPAVQAARVIPNGVDTAAFRPADKRAVRDALGIPPDVPVVLWTTGERGSPWRDHAMLRSTVERISGGPRVVSGFSRTPQRPLFVAVGKDAPITGTDVRFDGYQADPGAMARYYQAADIYLHCAKADTFPNAILEALACGTPVVATEVGGIPEQIHSVNLAALNPCGVEHVGRATGVLVAAGDAHAAAHAVVALLWNGAARELLGLNAVRDVGERFDLAQQIECHLEWYGAIIDHWASQAVSDH